MAARCAVVFVLLAGALLAILEPAPVARAAREDDALAEAERLRREGSQHLENTLIPGHDAKSERAKGIALLERARDLYDEVAAADPSRKPRTEEAIVDINAQLFWARRDSTVDIDDDDDEEAEDVDPDEAAEKALDEAERYEKENPARTFQVMVRYFEVAKRHVGTAASLKAQERSFDLQSRIIEQRKTDAEASPCETAVDVADFEASFQAIPDGDIGCFFWFGERLESHWMDAEAALCFERVLRADRGIYTERARLRLAHARLRLGRLDEARAVLERGANEGEAGAQDLLTRISGSQYGRLLEAFESAREKALGGGSDGPTALRRVAEEMRSSRESLPLLPIERVCSQITELTVRTDEAAEERGSAPCKICAPEGNGEASGSFMTCPTCNGSGQEKKIVRVREWNGRRWVYRNKETFERCSECKGNQRVVCKGCAGFTSVLGGIQSRDAKREREKIKDLRDEVWDKKMMTKASLTEAIQDVERYVVRKKMEFLARLDAPYHRSGPVRAAVGEPPLAGRVATAEAEALWVQAHPEVKANLLLSWAAEFAETLEFVAFLDDPRAMKSLSKGGPDTADPALLFPSEISAFPDETAGGFVRVEGKLTELLEDLENPYRIEVSIGSRFPHGVHAYIWKKESREILEGLAASYKLAYLADLAAAYDFSAESRARLLKAGTPVVLTGRVIPGPRPLLEVWRVEER